MSHNDLNNALSNYYKLKSKYETFNTKLKMRIINNSDLSKKEKQREFQKIKYKCVKCKNIGGSKFTSTISKVDGNKVRILQAICGNTENPCNLSIKIELPEIQLFPDVLKDIEEEVKSDKEAIIRYKNNILFGYSNSDQVVGDFNKLKENVTTIVETYSIYLDEYYSIIDNEGTSENITKNEIEINIAITEIKKLIKEYNSTNNNELIVDAIKLYTDILDPLLKKTMQVKYKENEVIFDANEHAYSLIQNKYKLADIEFSTSDAKVLMNVI